MPRISCQWMIAAWTVTVAMVCFINSPTTKALNVGPPLPSLLGTCLDENWVQATKAKLGLPLDQPAGLLHPFLQPALKEPRFWIDDPRTKTPQAFNCTEQSFTLSAAGVRVNGQGEVVDPGRVEGSLVVETDTWESHYLSTIVFSILAAEVYGYAVSMVMPEDFTHITERMSSVGRGACTPIHVNAEVWPVGIASLLDEFANESYVAGSIGYFGRSGLYTTKDFVDQGLTQSFQADFWKDYKYNDRLIDSLKASDLFKDTRFILGANNSCPDGVSGCEKGCSKSYACTVREQSTGKPCLVVALEHFESDPRYVQAVLSNLDVPAYFCFFGAFYGDYIADRVTNRQGVVFYDFEPDIFLMRNKGKYQRVFLPEALPERVALATGTFGENGFGQPSSSNPVDVDYPSVNLLKYASKVLQESSESNQRAGALFGKMTLSSEQLDEIFARYFELGGGGETGQQHGPDHEHLFRASCNWIKANYNVWKDWVEPLPLCNLESHVVFECETVLSNSSRQSKHPSVISMQKVSFAWRFPHPDNSSLPYDCAGGLLQLPSTLYTSHSCDWIQSRENSDEWSAWTVQTPPCTSSHYYSMVSLACDGGSREIHYSWRIPNTQNDSQSSLECIGGVELPSDETIPCDYISQTSGSFILIASFASLVVLALVACAGVLVRKSHCKVLEYSHLELLLVQIAGAIGICVSILVQVGEPSISLCVVRPALLSLSSTLLFGVLFTRAWTTHKLLGVKKTKRSRFFNEMKRKGVEILTALWLLDVVLLVCWFATNLPSPQLVASQRHYTTSPFFTGSIDDRVCGFNSGASGHQTDSVYSVMFFCKALVLLATLVVAIGNRHAQFDFGESFWLSACACTSMLLGLLLLLLTFLGSMPQELEFVFGNLLLLLGVLAVESLLLVPKFLALDIKESPFVQPAKHNVLVQDGVNGVGIHHAQQHHQVPKRASAYGFEDSKRKKTKSSVAPATQPSRTANGSAYPDMSSCPRSTTSKTSIPPPFPPDQPLRQPSTLFATPMLDLPPPDQSKTTSELTKNAWGSMHSFPRSEPHQQQVASPRKSLVVALQEQLAER